MCSPSFRLIAVAKYDVVGDHPHQPAVLDQEIALAGSIDPALVEEVLPVPYAAPAQFGRVQIGYREVVQRVVVAEDEEIAAVLCVGDVKPGPLYRGEGEVVG